jgi:hypothetical protein
LKGRSESLLIGEGWRFDFATSRTVGSIGILNKRRTFILKAVDGTELVTVNHALLNGNDKPRVTSLTFKMPIVGVPRELISRKPKRTDAGNYLLNLEGRFAVKSIKNCVLTDENDNAVMIVVKIGKNWLEVDARSGIDTNTIFCIGVSAFLCKL